MPTRSSWSTGARRCATWRSTDLDTRYLGLEDVKALHAEMMRDTGYVPAPLRAEGLLESAINRPQTATYYEDADLIRQAALLAAGIAENQPFLDGNKRTAYIALTVFLRVNGSPFGGDRMELAAQIEALGTRTDSLEAATERLEVCLRTNTAER